MNGLIKYIFLILTIMVNNDLLSQSPIPIMVYEKLENGEVNLMNKNVKLSYKIIGQPDDSLKSISLQDSIFELNGKIKDWIEVRIVENATKKIHVRKVYPPSTNKKISFYIGNSNLYEFFHGVMTPYYTPVFNQVCINIEPKKSLPNFDEYKTLLFQQGFVPIDNYAPFGVFKWGETEAEKAQQMNFLSDRDDIQGSPISKVCKSSTECSAFSNKVDILIRDSTDQETINNIFENLNLLQYYPTKKYGFVLTKFDKCISYQIVFTEKDMLSYAFLEKLNLLYLYENVLLIYQQKGQCIVLVD